MHLAIIRLSLAFKYFNSLRNFATFLDTKPRVVTSKVMTSKESQLIINSSLRLRYLSSFLRFAIKQLVSYGTVSSMTYTSDL